MKISLLVSLFLQVHAVAYAAVPTTPKPSASKPVFVVPDDERYARRCQFRFDPRMERFQGTMGRSGGIRPQGPMLWGTKRDWDTEKVAPEHDSVLVSADLAPLLQTVDGVKALRNEGGRLMSVPTTEGTVPVGVVGIVLQGTSSDGKPVEVAICGAEPSAEDPRMVFYRIEAWNALAYAWENPCVADSSVPDPRALAVGGVWDASGAHQEAPGKFTFACESGAITKCITWGYKPWAHRDGRPVADLHQACTRMARADYCGNGQSHTQQNTFIQFHDRLGIVERVERNPTNYSFEAVWATDGATCLARTRDGRAMESILQECPNRFQTGAVVELNAGERCTVHRVNVPPGSALLHNLTYAAPNR